MCFVAAVVALFAFSVRFFSIRLALFLHFHMAQNVECIYAPKTDASTYIQTIYDVFTIIEKQIVHFRAIRLERRTVITSQAPYRVRTLSLSLHI